MLDQAVRATAPGRQNHSDKRSDASSSTRATRRTPAVVPSRITSRTSGYATSRARPAPSGSWSSSRADGGRPAPELGARCSLCCRRSSAGRLGSTGSARIQWIGSTEHGSAASSGMPTTRIASRRSSARSRRIRRPANRPRLLSIGAEPDEYLLFPTRIGNLPNPRARGGNAVSCRRVPPTSRCTSSATRPGRTRADEGVHATRIDYYDQRVLHAPRPG
jgi:hypothetical protein